MSEVNDPKIWMVVRRGMIDTVAGPRPRCHHCRDELQPLYITEFADTHQGRRVISRKFTGKFGRQGDGYFCNTTCARNYAIAHVRHSANMPR